MPLEDAIVARIEQLITQAQTLAVGDPKYGNVDEAQGFAAESSTAAGGASSSTDRLQGCWGWPALPKKGT